MPLSDHLSFFAATDVGRKRKHNEDNFLVDRDLGLFVVADGMGGHAAGEVASAIAVRTVHEVVSQQRHMIEQRQSQGPQSEVSAKQLLGLLEYAVQIASQRVHREAQADPRKRGMGTTLSLLLVIDSWGYVAHVGDSRIYLVREGGVQQVTEDHTVANELLRLGMVTADQLHQVPRRHAITRAVGVYEHAEVDTLTLEILPNDQFLLASDGLCGYLDEQGVSLQPMLAGTEGDAVVGSLIDFANEHGGKDNITAVLVRFGGGDTSDSLRAKRLQLKREALSQMPLFSRLNERELLRVMQAAEVRQLASGDVVMSEGEVGEEMYVTLSGKLRVSTGKQVLLELGPGEHFGEMALIRSTPRSATVTALEASELISISRTDFFEIIRTEPPIAVKLLWQFLGVLANRLDHTSRQLKTARDQLGDRLETAHFIDEEPSLDPFSHPVERPMESLRYSLRQHLPPMHEGVLDDEESPPNRFEEDHQIEDSPSFDDAPPMAARIADPPSFDSIDEPSGARDDRTLESSAAVLAALGEGDIDRFDAQVTRPSRGSAAAAKGDEDDFDARKTLPGRSRQRLRAPTLKSAGSDPEIELARRGRDRVATVPDGMLRPQTPEKTTRKTGKGPKPGDPEFKPTKVTIPLEPSDALKSELEELRREFKERLKRSREERRRKDNND